MARYVCRCGSILSDSVTPEISYRVYSDHEWLDIVNDKTVTEGIMIPDSDLCAWVCRKCGRVYLWDNTRPSSRPLKVYIPE
ncbi:MAG: hypothetical protein MR241_05090 [Firmicutes bacterium]|uniref:Uncharacterized protein n=1 Tax=Candidatus Colimorpha enterica TaxID=3083063 RepID=A0AAE3FFX2_9BACT|nr:hypothetical protein [Candidatus Colimorpha enterica]